MVSLMKPLAKVTTKITKIPTVAKIVTKVSHNKPEIMLLAGAALIIVGFVRGIISGTHLQVVMEESAGEMRKLEASQKERRLQFNEPISEEHEKQLALIEKKELKKARAEGTWKVVKLFILPSGLIVAGLVFIGGGFKILRTRNVVLAGIAEGYKKMIDQYRKNVVEKEGEEADLNYMRSVIGDKEIESVVVDEDGNESKVKKRVPVVKEQKCNPWRFEFSDTYFDSYEDDTDRNLFFLKCEEDWFNHELERHGEVSMYEVLKHLRYKFDVLKASCNSKQEYRDRMTFLRNFGWRKGCGDGFVDFGLYRAINEPAITRQSDVVWIEMNCCGDLSGNLAERTYTK